MKELVIASEALNRSSAHLVFTIGCHGHPLRLFTPVDSSGWLTPPRLLRKNKRITMINKTIDLVIVVHTQSSQYVVFSFYSGNVCVHAGVCVCVLCGRAQVLFMSECV
jgi:hypothetical protein